MRLLPRTPSPHGRRPRTRIRARHARTGAWARKARDERGSASIQLVVLLPVMFAVMFLGLQAALFYHARTVAIAAAEEGARAAAAETGSTNQGVQAAAAFIALSGGADVLDQVSVSGRRSTATATVVVTGRSLSVIPGWSPTVRQTITVPTERITG